MAEYPDGYEQFTSLALTDHFGGSRPGADDPVQRWGTLEQVRALLLASLNTASKGVERNAQGVATVSGVQLDIAATPTQAEGMMQWDATEKALRVGVSATESLTVGEEMTPRYRNSTGSTLLQGEVVYANGATGSQTTVARAQADALATCRGTIGIVTDDAGIANNQRGRICIIGRSNNLNTSAWAEGTEIWLSPTVAGGLTSTKPSAEGQFVVLVGIVERQHASQGVINVNPHYLGSVTGEAVASAVSKSAARDAIEAAAAGLSNAEAQAALATKANIGTLAADITAAQAIRAYGDSITAGTTGTPYPTQLGTLTGYTITNGGVGGETSTQIADRVEADANTNQNWVLEMGRNNYSAQATVESDVARSVAHIGHDRVLVLGVLAGDFGAYERTGGEGRALIDALNDALETTYGDRYVDLNAEFVANGMTYAGISPTSIDTADAAAGIIPSSLRELSPIAVTSVTRSANTATVTTTAPHGYSSGDRVWIKGADQPEYNGTKDITVTSTTAFTFGGVANGVTTPATGTITATEVDRIHPNNAGNLALAKIVQAHLDRIIEADTRALSPSNVLPLFRNPPPIGTETRNTGAFSTLTTGATVSSWVTSFTNKLEGGIESRGSITVSNATSGQFQFSLSTDGTRCQLNKSLVPTISGRLLGASDARWGAIWGESINLSSLGNYVDDAAAAVGGVAVGGIYHTAGAVRVRLA
jgi:hypothetical protein